MEVVGRGVEARFETGVWPRAFYFLVERTSRPVVKPLSVVKPMWLYAKIYILCCSCNYFSLQFLAHLGFSYTMIDLSTLIKDILKREVYTVYWFIGCCRCKYTETASIDTASDTPSFTKFRVHRPTKWNFHWWSFPIMVLCATTQCLRLLWWASIRHFAWHLTKVISFSLNRFL